MVERLKIHYMSDKEAKAVVPADGSIKPFVAKTIRLTADEKIVLCDVVMMSPGIMSIDNPQQLDHTVEMLRDAPLARFAIEGLKTVLVMLVNGESRTNVTDAVRAFLNELGETLPIDTVQVMEDSSDSAN